MGKETVISNFTLKGREILSSYAAYTIEGEMTAEVQKGDEKWTILERNGIAKGTSDGESEAIYIPNPDAIKSMETNIRPLLPAKVIIKKPEDIFKAVEEFDLKLIEKALGRKDKSIRFGPRILDMDIIFFDEIILKTSNLVIPHPEMHKRRFVLAPVCDINPDTIHPVFHKSVKEIFGSIDENKQKVYKLTCDY